MTTEEGVIYLASCAINNEIPDRERIATMDLAKVHELAIKHKIDACISVALEAAGCNDAATTAAIAKAMRRNAYFEASLEEVTGKLQEAGIDYVPLKGILVKKYYPLEFMREMADLDILIDASKAEDVREIMEGLGFTTRNFARGFHDVYQKQPMYNYEMHRSLFNNANAKLCTYYEGKWDLSKPEDLYLYLVAHEYKHYADMGTGLRSLMDIYLFLKKESLDWDYVDREAEKIGIREFEFDNRMLATSLFSKGIVTDEKMLSYILTSNAYGTLQFRVDNHMRKSRGSKLRYYMHRLSVPVRRSDPRYKVYAAYYPLFYRVRILLPFLPFYRIIQGIKTGRIAAEWKAVRKK